MKLAIVGSRHFSDYDLLKREVETYVSVHGLELSSIVSGGAPGADTLAKRYAEENNITLTVFEAEWDTYGKKAGPIRNSKIVKECTDILAFCASNSVGTRDTIEKGRRSGKRVTVICI